MSKELDVKSLREALGESQEVFGKRFGVTQTAVTRWETKNPPTRGLVAEALRKLNAKTSSRGGVAA